MFGPILASLGQSGRGEEAMRLSMFSGLNPTLGTGIVCTPTPTAYDVTLPLMSFYNSDTTNQRQWILLDQIYMRATQANTSSTSYHLCFVKRKGQTASGGTLFTSTSVGGPATALITAQRTSIAIVRCGALTGTAADATTDRIIWREQVRDVIFAADDTLHITFGEGQMGTHGTTTSGTSKAVRMPPMWVGPGETLQINDISPSQGDDAAWEFSALWLERPAP